MRSSSRAALCFAAVLLLAAPARASNKDAETFFAQGRQLRASGDCVNAIVAFRRALDIKPEGVGALRNVAECEEQLGQFASARNDWWSLRRAVLQSSDPNYEGWEKDAESAYAKLAGKVAKLTVRASGDDLSRVRVSIDGKPLDPRLLGVELERDLGVHTIEATYGGVTPLVEKRTLVAGSSESVTLVIPSPKPGTRTAEGPSPTPTPPIVAPTDRSGLRTAGYVALGVGGLGAIGTVIASVVRGSALSTVEEACADPNVTCHASQEVADANSRGKTSAVLANVFGGVGIAGVVTGATLLLVSSRSSAVTPAPTSAAKVDGGFAALSGGGRLWAEVKF
ncbi:MAG: tetratricopeptide repeat protein [Byssovorax sp.]